MKISQKRLKEIILEELKKEIEEGFGGVPAGGGVATSWPIPARATPSTIQARRRAKFSRGTAQLSTSGLKGPDAAAEDAAQNIIDVVDDPGPQADYALVRALNVALTRILAGTEKKKGPGTEEKKGE